MNVTNLLKGIVESKGRDFVDYQNKELPIWKAWYAGFDESFHKYNIYNGTNAIERKRKSLGMAKQLCEDWASLLLNEKTKITLPNSHNDDFEKVLAKCKFWRKANEAVEISYALGIGAIVNTVEGASMTSDGQISTKGKFNCYFVDAEDLYPISYSNGEVVECAFVKEVGNQTIVQLHLLEEGQYTIYEINTTADGTNQNEQSLRTGSPIPWFHIIKPQQANNRTLEFGSGISIFANAIDILKAIDTKYDSFDNEFELGRKRVYVSAEALNVTVTKDGTSVVPTFDPNDVVFYTLPGQTEDGKPFVQSDTSDLRIQDHISAINQELNILSSKCGLGENYYKFDGAGGRPVQTATAAILQQGNLFRKIRKAEIGIEDFLLSFTESLIYICNNFTETNFGEINGDDIDIQFDDAIVDDQDKQRETDRKDVEAGLMSVAEYRSRWYPQNDEEADEFVHEHLTFKLFERYLPALQAGAMRPEDFVDAVYGEKCKEREERIKYIEANLSLNEIEELEDEGI